MAKMLYQSSTGGRHLTDWKHCHYYYIIHLLKGVKTQSIVNCCESLSFCKLLADIWQINPALFGIMREEDENKCVEQLNTLHSRLEEFEQLLTATNKPFFGGMTCEELDDDNDITVTACKI